MSKIQSSLALLRADAKVDSEGIVSDVVQDVLGTCKITFLP